MNILASDVEVLTGYRLYPAHQLVATGEEFAGGAPGAVSEVFAFDTDRYTTDAFYPPTLAALGEVGYLRDQAVAQVLLYPVQYNPARSELRIYHRLRVELSWPTPVQAASSDSARCLSHMSAC